MIICIAALMSRAGLLIRMSGGMFGTLVLKLCHSGSSVNVNMPVTKPCSMLIASIALTNA